METPLSARAAEYRLHHDPHAQQNIDYTTFQKIVEATRGLNKHHR
jgi:hypothetical protein